MPVLSATSVGDTEEAASSATDGHETSASATARLRGWDVLCPAPHRSPPRATASDSRRAPRWAPRPRVCRKGRPATSPPAKWGSLANVFPETLDCHLPGNVHHQHSNRGHLRVGPPGVVQRATCSNPACGRANPLPFLGLRLRAPVRLAIHSPRTVHAVRLGQGRLLCSVNGAFHWFGFERRPWSAHLHSGLLSPPPTPSQSPKCHLRWRVRGCSPGELVMEAWKQLKLMRA